MDDGRRMEGSAEPPRRPSSVVPQASPFLVVLVVMACFAANSVLTRYLVSRGLLDAAGVTVARFAAGAVTLVLLLATQGRGREAVPRGRDAWLAAALGGYALAIAYGYLYITAAAGTFVFYALVVATMTAGGAAVPRSADADAPAGTSSTRPTPRALAGAALALAGVGVLALGRAEGSTLLGVALLAITGATWGAYSLMLRERGDAVGTNAKAFLAVAVLSPFVLLAPVPGGDAAFTWPGLALAVFMGAVTTALAYAMWARVLPSLTPIQAGTYQLLVPVLTAAAGVLALGEPFGWRLALAGALVLTGMALSSRARPAVPARA